MAVLIPDMDKPKDCGHCRTVYLWDERLMCGIMHDETKRHGVPEWCPMREVELSKGEKNERK